jgi:Zn-dependent peptidase ImmA (M78 family)
MATALQEPTTSVFRLVAMADHYEGEQAASELLEECWDGRLPVNPIRIAKSLGIKVFNAALDEEVSGALVKKEGSDPSILLNVEDSRNRKRFTCAHEVGHFVRRSEEPEKYEYMDYRDPRSSTGSIEEERFANSFAANLLMPKAAVEALHADGMPDFRMALQFGVSREAMRNRLDNLGLLT